MTKYNAGYPAKFISNSLMICQDHPNVALTSNCPYINRYRKNNYTEKGLNDIVYEDYSEIETLKIENQLLKQQNNELLDKNRILNKHLTKEKQGKSNNIKTYTEITSNPKPKSKRANFNN